MDALPVGTLELVGAATSGRLVLASVAILRPLVGPVGAVVVAIAAPLGWNTRRVVALEGATAAGGFGTGSLVRAVRTVIVHVADEGGGHTLAVGTPELVTIAFSCSWRDRKTGKLFQSKTEADLNIC